MASYRWPSTDRHRPEDAIEHATYLKADFGSVSSTANASLANTSRLPSGLESRISIGITKGIAEARSKSFCPKWSEVDKSIFSQVMLKNITAEAALEARDRIPLPQFNGLHESYNALHTKLVDQIPPTATTHQFVGTGAATEATSVVDLVSAARKTSEEADKAATSLGMPTDRQEEKAEDINDEESGEDTDEEEDDEMDESEDGESEDGGSEVGESEVGERDQEIMRDGDDVSGDSSSEEDSSDDASGSEDGSDSDSDADGQEGRAQDIVRETTIPFIKGDRRSFSTPVNLKIEQQASVNRLEEMTAPELLSCLSRSLKTSLHEQQLSSKIMHISGVTLLDNGDLRVVIHTETREALQQIPDSADWSQKFEKALVCWQAPTWKVIMHNVKISSVRFQNRKEKAAIIRRLSEANRAISRENKKPIITDIRWSQYSLPKVESEIVIDFLNPEQATRALKYGLLWENKRHGCKREAKRQIKRCSRCQGYGHLDQGCSAPHRCGRCAEQHTTGTCKSRTLTCASCGGKHRAGSKDCPTKAKERRSLYFVKEAVSQAIKPAAETQATAPTPVRNSISATRTRTETSMPSPVSLDASSAEEIEAESDQSLPEADPKQDIHPDTATLLEKIEDLMKKSEDLRKIVVARDSALQTKSSGRTKRRAEEAFKSEADAESSDMATKRIKQEQPTHEGSMALWRQPSPFNVNRPE